VDGFCVLEKFLLGRKEERLNTYGRLAFKFGKGLIKLSVR